MLARNAAAKRHNADGESYLISAGNLSKSPLRSVMTVGTENLYFYINHINMPSLLRLGSQGCSSPIIMQ